MNDDKKAGVLAAIDSERAYQDLHWTQQGDTQGVPNRLTVGEFLLLLGEYHAQARTAWSREPKPESATLHVMRKIAGIAVNCMEQHGVPRREWSEEETAVRTVPAQRAEVYDALAGERAYQDAQWPGGGNATAGMVRRTVGDELMLIGEYLRRAAAEWAAEAAPERHTLHVVRKIAGIAYRCMEQHGAPLRDTDDPPRKHPNTASG